MDSRRDGRRQGLETFIPISKPNLSGNEWKYLKEAIDSGWISYRGNFESRFESDLTRFFGLPTITVSSGTGALHLALLRFRIGHGDEVIVPNLTFGATASAVKAVGAKVVFVDVKKNGCIDESLIREKITDRTKAVIPVHLYGEACDMEEINLIAKEHNLKVIEDSCEAFGIVPPSGDIACFSFYANKMITTGEGGCLVGDLGDAVEWRNGGFDRDYIHTVPGLNYRMTNLQAAVGCAQLERIDEILSDKLKAAEYYKNHLEGFGKWLFCVQTENREALRDELKKHGIETRPVFYPLNRCPAFETNETFPVSEWIWRNHLCIPMVEQELITKRIKDAVF